MKKRIRPKKSFIAHTAEHLFGVSILIAVAVVVTLSGKEFHRSLYSEAKSSTQFDPRATVYLSSDAPSASSLSLLPRGPDELTPESVEVMFSVQPGPITYCDTGRPLTPVFLLVTKQGAGNFLLSSDNGISGAQMEWGEYPLPNGNYTWRASVAPGYTGVGELSGSFQISNSCSKSTSSLGDEVSPPPPLSEVSGSANVPLPVARDVTSSSPKILQENLNPDTTPGAQQLPRPILRMFLDNAPITDPTRLFDAEELEFRVTTALADKVVITLDGGTSPKVLGNAEKDDLLSRPGTEVWALLWSPKEFPEGSIRVFTKVLHADGRITESAKSTLLIAHGGVPEKKGVAETARGGEVSTSVYVDTSRKREEILSRVTHPSLCGDAYECEVYCESSREAEKACHDFSATSTTGTQRGEHSLADMIPKDIVPQFLDPSLSRARMLPEGITSAPVLTRYCRTVEGGGVCKKMLIDAGLLSADDAERLAHIITEEKIQESRVFLERVGPRPFTDGDADGLSDYDEINIYHTDPASSDTDKDGFPDASEIVAHTNPNGKEEESFGGAEKMATTSASIAHSSGEEVLMENPKYAGDVMPEVVSLHSVVAEDKNEGGGSDDLAGAPPTLRFSGTAPPNSYVTLYVFSDPISLTQRTGESGVWSFVLRKELLDGHHDAYGAVTDSAGNILAKSEPLSFTKQGGTIIVSETRDNERVTRDGNKNGSFPYIAVIATLTGLIGISFSVAGFFFKQKNDVLSRYFSKR